MRRTRQIGYGLLPPSGPLRRLAALLAALAVILHASAPPAHGSARPPAIDALATDLAIHCIAAAETAPITPVAPTQGEFSPCSHCICPGATTVALALPASIILHAPPRIVTGSVPQDAAFGAQAGRYGSHRPRAPPALA